MQETNTAAKSIAQFIGVLLLIGVLSGKTLRFLTNWSTPELIGYNTSALLFLFGGIYLTYIGFKK